MRHSPLNAALCANKEVMKFIGKYGEHLVLSQLLKLDIEAYLAIKSNQEDYDITVVLESSRVLRIQVKTTDLHNQNTNNSISGVEKRYDFLVLVIMDKNTDHLFIMSREEALALKGSSVKFSCSFKQSGVSTIKPELEKYRDNWLTLTGA